MNLSSPDLPKSKVPAWERRRGPERLRWNGRRRNDPRLPRLDRLDRLDRPPTARRTLFYAVAGCLLGLGLLLLTTL